MERTTVVKLLLAIAAAAILVAAGMLLPKPSAQPADPATVPPDLVGQASLAPTYVPSPAPSLAQTSLYVYVCGAVRRPGVYTLPAGSRVVDAIAQAGGAKSNGDLEQLNLAEAVADAMKIDVPVRGQPLAQADGIAGGAGYISPTGGRSRGASTRSGRHHAGRGGSTKLQAGQTVDINTASEADLVHLPGVGPSLARRIVEYRTANGPFQMPDDLQNVSGIGPNKYAKMQPFIRV